MSKIHLEEERMKRLVSNGMIAAALFFFSFAISLTDAHEGANPAEKRLFTKHFQETLFDITGRASYSVEVLLNDNEYEIGKNVIGIVLHDEHDEDVKGAKLTIVHRNLATNEKASGALTVEDKGNGLYIVKGLTLQRDGRWELAITVEKGGDRDSVQFVLPDALKQRVAKGRYSK